MPTKLALGTSLETQDLQDVSPLITWTTGAPVWEVRDISMKSRKSVNISIICWFTDILRQKWSLYNNSSKIESILNNILYVYHMISQKQKQNDLNHFKLFPCYWTTTECVK